MHFFQLAAAWLFPCAVCATMVTTATAAADGASTVEHESSSSASFRAGNVKVKAAGADTGCSPSASSTTSSSTSSLLGSRCGSPNSTRSPEKQGGAALTPRGDAVRRCLRRLSRKLHGGAGDDDERPDGRRERKRKNRSRKQPEGRGTGVEDGTAREREQAVASAIAYCKETMTRPRGTSPPPPPPSLDGWLLDQPEEEIGSSCGAPRCKCPSLRRNVSLLEWLPEAQARTSAAAVPHHRGCTPASDECGGKSASAAAESGKRASRRGPAGDLGMGDIFDLLDADALDGMVRITNYFSAKYEQCNVA